MSITRTAQTCFLLILLGLASAPSVVAAEQAPAQPSSWPWWQAMHGPTFWWIFPFMFFIFMIVMVIFMMRRGGMGCMWRGRMWDSAEFHEAMKHSRGEPSETALEILNKRYAKGEIDKQEYEEKKAAIARSG